MKGDLADMAAGGAAGADPRDPLVQANHLSIVFNSARDMMLFAKVEPGGVIRIVSVNRPYMETIRSAGLNFKAADIEGRTFGELLALYNFDAATMAAIQRRYEQVIQTKQVLEYEEVTRTPAGVFHGRSTITPILDEENVCRYLLYSSQDVTAQKRAEQALRDSEEKFSKTFRATPDAISVHEMASGRYVDANPGVLHFFGYKREEIIGRTPSELGFWVDEGDRAKFLERLHREGSVRDFVARFRLRHGETRVAELSAELVEIGGLPHNVTVLRDMTARLQYEHALRDSEEKFAKAFRMSPDAISLTERATGRILEVNEGFEKICGYPRDQLIGRTSRELGFWVNPENRERMLEELRVRGFVRDMEVMARPRDGSERTFLFSAEPVEIGGRACLVIVSRDITVQKRAEQALRESEEKFATAFRVSPDIMSISEFETGRYIEVNEAHEKHFGFTRAESIGRSPLELGIISEKSVRDEMLRQLEETGHVRDFKVHGRTKDGRLSVVLLSAETIYLGGRKCIFRVSHDITAALGAEEALRESEEKFAKAFRGSPYAQIISDLATGRYLDVNDSFERVTGFTRQEALGRTSSDLGVWVNPSDRDELVRRLLEKGSVRKMEVSFRAKDGHIVITLCNGDLIEVAGKPCILSTFEDISEQRRIEEQKARLESQLRQSQKLEALGTLAGGIAHDFNNILSAMIVYRELAVMDIDRPEELRGHLAEIGLASNRAKDLVRQILTFSRQQQQERRAVQLHPVVREALQLLRASLPSTIEIIPVIDEQAPQVLADTSQVHQIMMNLATNAAHAMRNEPGRLKVTLCRRLVDDAHAQCHPGLRPGAYVRLSIADTGCGMDENTVARIFEPFFTTKGPGEGTGLGLSVVHGIMEDHDGAITVNSRPGEGTNFDLYFPEYVGAAGASMERETGIPRGNGESVLLIDDETALCEAMRTTLEKLGYRVTAFMNPLEAVAQFCAAPQDFDLLVTDHTMPHMTGLDVIQKVRCLRTELPVLLCSGLSGTWTPEKLRGFNIRDIVTKPIDFAGLARVVHRALGHRHTPTA